ncbi:hypothetical protein PN462_06020 [Spirulina sp. CS-785/01]|uniref:energy transducer TonB n=1 Tax=Spirulina sp. CS-785/01 TaxID=3021716 RepID=UPI00232B8ACD|nr:hypothetical protein [Spirulina sp. CS-785/01]MDB9312653.1 hypothetical protein [Spirulina sp. CS-785/01]
MGTALNRCSKSAMRSRSYFPTHSLRELYHDDSPTLWVALLLWSVAIHIVLGGILWAILSQARSGQTSSSPSVQPQDFVPVDFIVQTPPQKTSSPMSDPVSPVASSPPTPSTPSPNSVSPTPRQNTSNNNSPQPSPDTSETSNPSPETSNPSPDTSETSNPSPETSNPSPDTSETSNPSPDTSNNNSPQPSPNNGQTPQQSNLEPPNPSPAQPVSQGTPGQNGDTGTNRETGSGQFLATLGQLRLTIPDRDIPTQLAQLQQTRQQLDAVQYLQPLDLENVEPFTVQVVVVIEPNGSVTVYPESAQVLSGTISAGKAGQLAKRVIEQWSFEPSYMDGEPVAQEYFIEFSARSL